MEEEARCRIGIIPGGGQGILPLVLLEVDRKGTAGRDRTGAGPVPVTDRAGAVPDDRPAVLGAGALKDRYLVVALVDQDQPLGGAGQSLGLDEHAASGAGQIRLAAAVEPDAVHGLILLDHAVAVHIVIGAVDLLPAGLQYAVLVEVIRLAVNGLESLIAAGLLGDIVGLLVNDLPAGHLLAVLVEIELAAVDRPPAVDGQRTVGIVMMGARADGGAHLLAGLQIRDRYLLLAGQLVPAGQELIVAEILPASVIALPAVHGHALLIDKYPFAVQLIEAVAGIDAPDNGNTLGIENMMSLAEGDLLAGDLTLYCKFLGGINGSLVIITCTQVKVMPAVLFRFMPALIVGAFLGRAGRIISCIFSVLGPAAGFFDRDGSLDVLPAACGGFGDLGRDHDLAALFGDQDAGAADSAGRGGIDAPCNLILAGRRARLDLERTGIEHLDGTGNDHLIAVFQLFGSQKLIQLLFDDLFLFRSFRRRQGSVFFRIRGFHDILIFLGGRVCSVRGDRLIGPVCSGFRGIVCQRLFPVILSGRLCFRLVRFPVRAGFFRLPFVSGTVLRHNDLGLFLFLFFRFFYNCCIRLGRACFRSRGRHCCQHDRRKQNGNLTLHLHPSFTKQIWVNDRPAQYLFHTAGNFHNTTFAF